MMSDAFVRVSCDHHRCEAFEEIELTPLARRGSYDIRNVAGDLKSRGWMLTDSNTYCEEHANEYRDAQESPDA